MRFTTTLPPASSPASVSRQAAVSTGCEAMAETAAALSSAVVALGT